MTADYILDDEPPSNVRPFVRPARPARASGQVPSCPYCGEHDTASRVDHPSGAPWFCACGSLFTGSDDEWRRLAEHRRMATERRARDSQEAS